MTSATTSNNNTRPNGDQSETQQPKEEIGLQIVDGDKSAKSALSPSKILSTAQNSQRHNQSIWGNRRLNDNSALM